jgi:hypothetical protein
MAINLTPDFYAGFLSCLFILVFLVALREIWRMVILVALREVWNFESSKATRKQMAAWFGKVRQFGGRLFKGFKNLLTSRIRRVMFWPYRVGQRVSLDGGSGKNYDGSVDINFEAGIYVIEALEFQNGKRTAIIRLSRQSGTPVRIPWHELVDLKVH